MDELAKRLREDAVQIDATVSPELERRIDASLHAAEPVRPAVGRRSRSWTFWLASSLTGAAVAIAVIALLNMRPPQQVQPPAIVNTVPPAEAFDVPAVDLKAETAVLTAPLVEELDALESDMKKLEQKVRDEMGL